LQAIRGATINGATFLNRTARHGTVSVGKAADLLILNRNPLADIRATRAIAGVLMRGQYHDRAALDGMLRATAEAVARMPGSGR
jgi:imidazolonepropionase-like amidohydrolase